MFKLVLEKAEEPEIKLPTSAGASKKQERSRLLHPPPSARAEGLLFLHGLESNPGSSLQMEEEAGLP